MCCDYSFYDVGIFYDHVVTRHGAPQHIFRCFVCSETFETAHALKRHMQWHKYDVKRCPFACPHNARFFGGLVNHLRAPKHSDNKHAAGHGYVGQEALDLMNVVWKIKRNKRDVVNPNHHIPYSPSEYCRLDCEYSTAIPRFMKQHLSSLADVRKFSHIAAGHLTANEVEDVLCRLWPVLDQ